MAANTDQRRGVLHRTGLLDAPAGYRRFTHVLAPTLAVGLALYIAVMSGVWREAPLGGGVFAALAAAGIVSGDRGFHIRRATRRRGALAAAGIAVVAYSAVAAIVAMIASL